MVTLYTQENLIKDVGTLMDGPRERHVIGGTRTVLLDKDGDILFIAFRGSAGKKDWVDNSHFGLVSLHGEDEKERVHRGFHERAGKILEELVEKLPQNLPKTIVITGHSLGAALSQVVYIQLKDVIMKTRKLSGFNSKIINISFAGPLVGNMDLRNQMGEGQKDLAKSMYHFVLSEDIIPAMPFYQHAYQKLPEPLINFSKSDYYHHIMSHIMVGDGAPAELYQVFVPPLYDQPIYDNDSSLEPYAPIGNYLYIKEDKLYEFPYHMDPQFVAQALISILDVMRKMGPVQALPMPHQKLGHPLVVKLRADHWIKNYSNKLDSFTT